MLGPDRGVVHVDLSPNLHVEDAVLGYLEKEFANLYTSVWKMFAMQLYFVVTLRCRPKDSWYRDQMVPQNKGEFGRPLAMFFDFTLFIISIFMSTFIFFDLIADSI